MRVVPLARFLIFYFHSWIFEKTSKFWAASCKNESNILLVRITVCLESCLPIGWHTFFMKKSAKVLLYFGLDCGMLEFFTTSHKPKNNWNPSRIFVARFSGKDHGFSICKPWSKQAWGWIHFCMKRFKTLYSYQIFKIKNIKIKNLLRLMSFSRPIQWYHSHLSWVLYVCSTQLLRHSNQSTSTDTYIRLHKS